MAQSFGEMIKQSRSRLGWTQRDLADRLRVGQQAVSRWEREASRPSRAVVARIADLLELDTDALQIAGDSDAMPDEGNEARPPVRPLSTRLPLQELPPEVFEQFSADLVSALHPQARVHRYGAQGHTQGGIDVIINHPDGKPSGVQCKREQRFGPAQVRKAVGELTIDIGHCYIFLTRTASPQARQEIDKHPSWTLWDVDDLSRKVRSLPDRDAAVRLVDTYFPGWRESFLGVPSPGPWLTTEEFFRPFVKEGIYSHKWELVGRAAELTGLRTYIADADPSERIAVVTGRGGIGKTRLLRALACELDTGEQVTVRFLAIGASVDAGDFELLPPDNRLVVVVDDAHDRPDNAAIIAGVQRFRPKAKMLLSLRPYGLAHLHTELRQVGVHPAQLPTCELDDLTVQDAESLAHTILGSEVNRVVGQRLAELAPDCPLLIVVGATLITRGILDPSRLEASEDIRAEILQAFGAAVVDTPKTGEAELRREILKAVAVLQPFRLDQPDFQEVASALTGRPFDQLIPHLRALQDAGVLMRRGASVRIIPDLLGDVLLADAALDAPSGASTGYLERVCDATSGVTLAHAVVNASRVDWQTRSQGNDGDSAVGVLWAALATEFETGEASSRPRILQAVRHVAAFQPRHAIILVRSALGGPSRAGYVDQAHTMENDDVIRELPGILHRIAFNLDHLAEAADLLWKLARWDTRPPHRHPEHPTRLLANLAEYARGKPADFQYGMIAAAQRWLRDDNNVAAHPHSPFAVLEPILATEIEQRRSDGLTLTFRAYPVNIDVVRPIRDRVVDLAFAEAHVGDARRAVRAVQALGSAVRYPMGKFGRAIGNQERVSWTPTFVDIIGRLSRLATHAGLDPIVAVAVRRAVHWHAQYATGETNRAAQAVRSALPDSTEHRLAHVLHDGSSPSLPELEDFDEWSRRQETHFTKVAAEACGCWSPDEVVDHLARRLTLDHYAYGEDTAAPGPFLLTLVRHHPEVGAALIRRVCSDTTNPAPASPDPMKVLRALAPVTLSALTESLPVEAMSLAQALVDTPNVVNTRAVACAFGRGRGNRTVLLEGEAGLLRRLIAHSDPHVRGHSVAAVRTLADSNRELAMQLVTGVRFDDSLTLAAEVAALLKTSGNVSWKQLSAAQVTDLFEQLHNCPSIEDYHITHLLAEMSVDYPEQVLDLLIRRIKTYEHNASPSEYEPLPFQWHNPVHFRASKDFERLLRRVLNWITAQPRSWIRERMGAELFSTLAGNFDDQVLGLLSEAVSSGSREQLLAVGAVLSGAPRDFAWNNTGFVIDALRTAERHGDDYVQAIGGGLHSAAIRGMRAGTPGKPFREDIEQRDKASELAAALPPGSIEHKFYRSLASTAESSIKWTIDRDAVLHDRRTW